MHKKIILLWCIIFVATTTIFYLYQLFFDGPAKIEECHTSIIVRPVVANVTQSLASENLYSPLLDVEYLVNSQSIGVGEIGAKKLLSILLKINNCYIDIRNPLTVHDHSINGSGSIYRDTTYKYPFIRDCQLRAQIVSEIDRIRQTKSDPFPSDFLEIDPETGEEVDRF